MEVLTKRYNHDHVSSYKNRGDKLGASNRFIRAHRANKERKAVRGGELAKRRGLDDTQDEKKPGNKEKDVAKAQPVVKGKVSEKENQATEQITDQRKAMLLKWREQRELKKKADAATKGQKSVFAVRHIQYNDTNPTLAPVGIKPNKKTLPKPKETIPDKKVTRSSARIANKQPTKPAATKVKSTVKDVVKAKKSSKQVEEQITLKRVTRQSAKSTSTSVVKTKPKSTRKKQEDQPKKDNDSECLKTKQTQNSTSNPTVECEQEIKSFAPTNYQFTAPTGLNTFEYYSKEFKFEPLSPRSTSNFFEGIAAFPSPKRDVITNQNFVPMSTSSTCDTDPKEMFVDNKDKNQTGNVENEANDAIDSKYFRNLISSETTRLNDLCDKWEKVLESTEELTEEVKGNIRTAVGQAQLLISQRFKQFSGLIDLSEDESAEKKANMSDLQGFWDMIYFQVEDVNNKMGVLEKQKENGWVVEEKTVKKKKTKKILPKKSEGPKGGKPGGKSRIQELRAAMKAKMAEKKKLLSQNNEECSFITVLTPVKKNKNSGSHGDIILTPVRRSLRNTPIHQSASRATPKVISTPKACSASSPGLRLTPEVVSATTNNVNVEDFEMKEEQESEEMREEQCKEPQMEIKVEEKSTEESHSQENISDSAGGSTSESTDEDMKSEKASLSSKRRSCLRSSTKRTRKSSRVFFQSPEPSAHSTAGGTPGAIVFTPGLHKNKLPTNVVFTPVAVSFDSPTEEGDTCSIDAGHTPAMVLSGSRSLRSRKGTPCRKRNLATPDDSVSTPVGKEGGSVAKRRSLRRRSGRKSSSEEETFLPDKYILPSASSESDEEEQFTALSAEKPEMFGRDQPLLSFTPLKDSSDRLNKSNLTPASRLQALRLDDTPDNRRDSVFFAPDGQQQAEQAEKDNLICFSPLAE